MSNADEILVDEVNQRGAEHNKKVWDSTLVEAGFEGVISRSLSRFSILMHDRTLGPTERREFEEWAEEQDAVQHVCDDLDGSIYRVQI